ncbi:MAG: hypothetical protein OXH99_12755 [Bryobacterales bacterium]|nr:hypothetical protein [Bryobacterales bacterium]MDE0627262.1 hypothetical protein [Bryobacterales bacterium]
MASGPSIRYNIEPRVETLYSAPDYELRLLSAFDLATTFLVIVMGELATVATTPALSDAPWSAGKAGTFASLIAVALALTVWLVWNILTAKSMVRRIRKRSRLKSNGNGGKL